MSDATCACGRPIVHPPTGRRRTKCETCSPTKSRTTVVPLPPPGAPVRGTTRMSVGEAVRAELDAVGRLDTVDGAAAVYAADMLDAGGHTGPSAAALLKEVRAAVEAAKKGAQAGASLVDELRRRREVRRSG